jgi:bacillopeptidase F (M6 metalloprotease family)
VPVSELCVKQGLQPTVFYRWQKEFFENGAAAFQQNWQVDVSSINISRTFYYLCSILDGCSR